MKYRLLGTSGLRISEAALGTMTFGDWGSLKDEAQKVYETYREAGETSLTQRTCRPAARANNLWVSSSRAIVRVSF